MQTSDIKTCILCIQRYEKDILDWVDYHLYKLGFDHIFIIDTNDPGDELVIYNKQVTVIHKEMPPVTHIGWGKQQMQLVNSEIDNIYNLGYHWCALIDIDEYLDFYGRTVKEYVLDKEEEGSNAVEISWITYSDNGLLFNDKAGVINIYKDETERKRGKWCDDEFSWGKTIFKLDTGIRCKQEIHWISNHTYSDGTPIKRKHESIDVAFVRHYRTKSLNDYLSKVAYRKLRQSCLNYYQGGIVNVYYMFNKPTKESLENFEILAEMKGIRLNPKEKETLEKLKQKAE